MRMRPGATSGKPLSSVPSIRGAFAALLLGALACTAGPRGSGSETGADAVALRVVAYNIKHGRGMDDVVDLVRIADVLRSLNADVIALQEVDDRTDRTGGVDQVGVLGELLGYRGVHGPHRPYQGGHYGNAVLTRLPIGTTITHAIPSASGSALAVLEVEVVTERGPVSVVSVHLAGSPDERMAQADVITELFAGRSKPVVLAGDFNGRPDDAVVEALRSRWMVLEKSGARLTYPADEPDREIDFVMIQRDALLQPMRHVVAPEAVASDHRPLIADFRFGTSSPSPAPRHEAPPV
ncbi:MAG: hypothetical protein HKN72_09385 [Gemmatimonadetes bacterium]|nr:hypothetical protein [Gemmatimonadota bacterium]